MCLIIFPWRWILWGGHFVFVYPSSFLFFVIYMYTALYARVLTHPREYVKMCVSPRILFIFLRIPPLALSFSAFRPSLPLVSVAHNFSLSLNLTFLFPLNYNFWTFKLESVSYFVRFKVGSLPSKTILRWSIKLCALFWENALLR